MKKRILSWTLILTLLVGTLPIMAFAADGVQQPSASQAGNGKFEYNDQVYDTLTKAVEAVGESKGTIYVTGDMTITKNEKVNISQKAEITITSKGENLFTVTKEADEWTIKLMGGVLTLENIIFDGNAQWSAEADGKWYERTANGTVSKYPLIYDHQQLDNSYHGEGGTLILGHGSIIQNFYVNRALEVNSDATLGGYSGTEEWSLFDLSSTTLRIYDSIIQDNAVKSDVKFYREIYGRNNICSGMIDAMNCTIEMNDSKLTRNWIVSDVGHTEATGAEQKDKYSSDLRNGSSGGHLTMTGGTFTMNGGEISYGYATDGGGIAASDAELTINNGVITRNIAGHTGGGITMWDANCKLTMNRGEISHNTVLNRSVDFNDQIRQVQGLGGGLCIASHQDTLSEINISDAKISNNVAALSGGFYLENCNGNIRNTAISNNRAEGIKNFAQGIGGGGQVFGGEIQFIKSKIEENKASNIGGGLAVKNSEIAIDHTVIQKNATDQGGGIAVSQDGRVKILENSLITQNMATTVGGGILLQGDKSEVALINSNIINNATAMAFGGSAVMCFAEKDTTAPKFYLDGNDAKVQGDITLYSATDDLPTIHLISAVPTDKKISIQFLNPNHITDGRIVVEPDRFEYSGTVKELDNAEPYSQNFYSNERAIVPGTHVQQNGKLVIGGPAATIKFHAGNHGNFDGGIKMVSITCEKDSAFPTAPALIAESGYTFDGWYDTNGAKVDKFSATVVGNMEYIAHWKKSGGSSNGGSSSGGSSSGGSSSSTRYTIDASAEAGGSISPYGKVQVDPGAEKTFQIIADKGHTIKDVLIDGKSVGVVSTYSFKNVRTSHTIKAVFVKVAGTGVADKLNTKDHEAYLYGYTNGNFGPNNNMTRAEVAQMFYNLLLNKDVSITAHFTDVSTGAWYAKAVETLASIGVIEGVGEEQFAPERTITRAEFTVIAMRFTKQDVSGKNTFTDVMENDWFYQQVVGAIKYGWISGYSDGTFRPNNTITRAEVTTITNHMLDRSADKQYVDTHTSGLRQFGDLLPSHWAYYDIMEATNSHTYDKSHGIEKWQNT